MRKVRFSQLKSGSPQFCISNNSPYNLAAGEFEIESPDHQIDKFLEEFTSQ